MLLAPDLLAGASRVHADGFWDQRFPWEQEVRMAKLHFASEPKVLAQALELPHGGREAYAALAALARALHESETWRRFVAAHKPEPGRPGPSQDKPPRVPKAGR